ncbi:MCP four helix bundle domain-containing protein [Pedobacter cryophilus]|uniref:Chemotaxis methyl-accepting receptor HlyB-like 4HB MCP domain-containing protein n=1 Tax=Pedobacter cryophilus TaxID=2571271 RepID=A0A4U1BZC0_9SPHI|nr:MCP four helix bundle domain-containing protein [Pedobacter cryophilus]TKB97858.1 hypothetical protein FA046_10940 [Pedobacter cryophilus]
MKWSLMFKEKMKAAIILSVLMIAIIISNVFEKRILQNSSDKFASIYEDRLEPSSYLYEMREANAKKIILLNQLSEQNSSVSKAALNKELLATVNEFNGLLYKYERTFLVKQEKQLLKQLKTEVVSFNSLTANFQNSDAQYLTSIKSLSISINKKLSELNKIQPKIGQELLRDYKNDTYHSSLLNSIQIVISIILGLIILNMVAHSRMLNNLDQKKFNLN